jgi:integrase/recombinase XerD
LFFEYLVKTDTIGINPATHLPPVRGRPSRPRSPVPKAVMEKILQHMGRSTWTESRNFVMISMLWALGLRVKELVKLRVCDLDLDLDPGREVGTVLIRGKGRKERRLFVVERLYRVLKAYVEHQKSPKRPENPLFPHCGRMKAVSCTRVRQVLAEAAAVAGVGEKVTPHMLRHAFATEMYHNGVPIDAVRELLGHDSIAESAVYVHVSEKLKAEILETLSVSKGVSPCRMQ